MDNLLIFFYNFLVKVLNKLNFKRYIFYDVYKIKNNGKISNIGNIYCNL